MKVVIRYKHLLPSGPDFGVLLALLLAVLGSFDTLVDLRNVRIDGFEPSRLMLWTAGPPIEPCADDFGPTLEALLPKPVEAG